jgi:hypothetical protein
MWKIAELTGEIPLLAAKIAVDEVACGVRRVFTRPLLDGQWRRVIGEVEDTVEFFEQHGWLDRPSLYHDEPTSLRRLKSSRDRCLGLDFRHLTFTSDYEPHSGEAGRGRWLGYRPNRTAHAWMVRHRGRPRPWLICIPGYGMGIPYLDMTAFRVPWLSRRLGLNILIPVLPFHGPRRLQWASGDGFFGGDCLDTIHAEAQAIWELRQLIGWLRQHEAPAVGIYGLSLGGYTGAVLASFETDLACVIAGIPASDFCRLAQMHIPARILRTAEMLGLDWAKVKQIFRVVSPLSLRPLVPRERRFIFAGSEDRIVPRTHVTDLWKHWERPQTIWYRGSHLSFYFEREVYEWLRPILRAFICARASRPPLSIAASEPARQAA